MALFRTSTVYQPSLSIELLTSVNAPPNITLSTSKTPTPNPITFNTLKETIDVLHTNEPLWVQSKVPHSIDSVEALCRTNSSFTVHQYVVHPTDTLSSLLGSVHEEGKHLSYTKTPFSHMLQQLIPLSLSIIVTVIRY